MLRRVGFRLAMGLVVLGCGGHTEGGSQEPTDSEPTEGAPASPSPGQGYPEGDTELGECKLGFPQFGTGKLCAWVADDRCYDTREMACNCACPRDRDSQCSSGFDDGPDGRVLVSCN